MNQVHLVWIYPLFWLSRAGLTSDISILVSCHLFRIFHDQPTSKTLKWRAVRSPQMLPVQKTLVFVLALTFIFLLQL